MLRTALAAADTRRDGRLPMDLPGVTETFADELDLLAAMQLRWHSRLAGQLERALHDDPTDLSRAVATAWADTARAMPGVRLVLDVHRDEPVDDAMARAMTKATDKERSMLAVMAGLAGVQDEAAHIGARLEQQARERLASDVGTTEVLVPVGRGGNLMSRLRNLLAA
ncbi:MAG: hypothetical protein CMH83_13765 [Nocardioides sp.]|nr:hypothetical protein [Nocardioides sp.]